MSDGSVIIEVELTDEDIEKGLKSIKANIKDLEKSSSGIANKISNNFEKIGNVSNKVGNALTVGLTTPLIGLATAGVKYNAQMEDFEANLTTLLGNADDAKDMLNDLKQMANTTPFETSDLLEATQMMLGFGLQANKTKGYLQTLGDISMGNSEKLMSLTRAFSQIGASGKATMEDINQMIDAGFNPLQVMSEKTGKSMAKLRDEVSDGKISFEDIADAMETATSEGGRYYKSMEKASKTMNGKFSSALDALKTALGDLTKSLLPIATKVIDKITEWANAFAELDDATKETILKIAGVVAAVGPAIKIFGKISSGVSGAIKVFGKFKSGLDTIKKAMSNTSSTTGSFSKMISGLTSPIGLAVTAIGILAIAIGTKLYNSLKQAGEGMNDVGTSMNNFISGVESAEGYLDQFNNTLFSSTKEQSVLEDEMQSIQNGITLISKTASDERREYTQAEIDQLEDYFNKMRELQEQQMEIEQQKGEVIVQNAQTENEAFQGNYEEYKVLAQNWIKTAQDQANKQKEIAEEYRINTIANLNTMYNDRKEIDKAEYDRLVQQAWDEYNTRVASANQQVADVTAIYSQGASDRIALDTELNAKLQELTSQSEAQQQQHAQNIENIKKWTKEGSAMQNNLLQGAEMAHKISMQKIWQEMDSNLSDSQREQLGSWMGMLAQSELYGNKIEDEDKKTVDAILDAWEYMPEESKKTMTDTMQGMLNGMKEKEGSLFAKASSIATSILGRLNTIFDIGSPSKETEKIFKYVVEGGEVGLDKKKKSLFKDVDNIAKGVLKRLQNKDLYNKMQSAVNFETQKLSTNLSATATSNKVLTANITMNTPDIYMDTTKVARVVTPAVSRTLRGAGAY